MAASAAGASLVELNTVGAGLTAGHAESLGEVHLAPAEDLIGCAPAEDGAGDQDAVVLNEGCDQRLPGSGRVEVVEIQPPVLQLGPEGLYQRVRVRHVDLGAHPPEAHAHRWDERCLLSVRNVYINRILRNAPPVRLRHEL